MNRKLIAWLLATMMILAVFATAVAPTVAADTSTDSGTAADTSMGTGTADALHTSIDTSKYIENHITDIQADKVWAEGYTGKGVKIAILDSGIDRNHPALKNNIAGGWNFVDDNDDYSDVDGHGTEVAGVIVGQNDNNIYGVAPDAQLYIGKVCGYANSPGIPKDLVDGINWATNLGVDVISISLGGPDTQSKRDAIENAYKKGIVVVASAGNFQSGQPTSIMYPANYPHVICVTGVAETNNGWDWWPNSCHGGQADISAPSQDIQTTSWNPYGSMYNTPDGTSFACPQVAGTVALIRQKYPGEKPQAVRERLIMSATDVNAAGWDEYTGYGLLNAYAATRPDYDSRPIYSSGNTLIGPIYMKSGTSYTVSVPMENTGVKPWQYSSGDMLYNANVAATAFTKGTPYYELPVGAFIKYGGQNTFQVPLKARSGALEGSYNYLTYQMRHGKYGPYFGEKATIWVIIDNKPPEITSYSPTDNYAQLLTPVQAIFNEGVQDLDANQMTVMETLSGKKVTGNIIHAINSNTVTFWPNTYLTSGTQYTVRINNVKDLAGNTMTKTVSWTFRTTDEFNPPVTIATMTSGTMGNNGWYTTMPNVVLDATDDGSGVASTEYKTEGDLTSTNGWVPYMGEITLPAGAYTFYYRSTDKAGNVETVKSMDFKVDVDPPFIQFDTPQDGARYRVGDSILVHYTVTEEESHKYTCSPLLMYYATAANGKPIAIGDPIDTSTPGVYSFAIEAYDDAGNYNKQTISYEVYAPPGPYLITKYPADGAKDVTMDSDIIGTWNEPIKDFGQITVTADGTEIQYLATTDGNSFSLTPVPYPYLPRGKVITVTVAGATDMDGNKQVPNPDTWSFTTVPLPPP